MGPPGAADWGRCRGPPNRREAGAILGLPPSTAVRWLDRWTTTGSVEAKPGTGHSRSPLKAHEQWLLDLVASEPDLTLEEIRARLKRGKKLKVAVSSVWRFYARHAVTFKKSPARGMPEACLRHDTGPT